MPNINKYVLAVPITAIFIILALLVGSAIFKAKGESDKNAGQVSVEKEKVDNISTIEPPKQVEPKREDTSSNPQDKKRQRILLMTERISPSLFLVLHLYQIQIIQSLTIQTLSIHIQMRNTEYRRNSISQKLLVNIGMTKMDLKQEQNQGKGALLQPKTILQIENTRSKIRE